MWTVDGRERTETIYSSRMSRGVIDLAPRLESGYDRTWVQDVLLQTLENDENKYSLCLHERDFRLGRYIMDNVAECMDISCNVILVLSPNFVRSKVANATGLIATISYGGKNTTVGRPNKVLGRRDLPQCHFHPQPLTTTFSNLPYFLSIPRATPTNLSMASASCWWWLLRYELHRLISFLKVNWRAPVDPYDLAKWGFYYLGTDDVARCHFCRLEVRGWEQACPFLRGREVGNVPLGQGQPRNVRSDSANVAIDAGRGDRVICFYCGGGLKDWGVGDGAWVEHAVWFQNCQYLLLIKGLAFVEQVRALREAQSAFEHWKDGVPV
ncbi:hypothetical protein B566_EDAN011489 [Ephemera danica]|nr:hypothetical protein B566_EDAN011489 [Ephemera danica]